MTNFERIKAMSVEEMADFFVRVGISCDICKNRQSCCCGKPRSCKNGYKKYLESEVQENDT